MRILLCSDVHANIIALETVLQHAPRYDALWCLGDVVGYGPAPNECVARLRGLGAVVLTGNHDRAVLGDLPLDQFRGSARAALEWTMRVLQPENAEWLRTLPLKKILAEYSLTLVHGSPRDPIWEYIDTEDVALENFEYFDTAYCFFGHTHKPLAYRLRIREKILKVSFLPQGVPYLMEPKLLLNPGSLGQPRDGDRRAAYAIYDTDAQHITSYRIEYDVFAVQRAMENAHLPERLIARLAQGA